MAGTGSLPGGNPLLGVRRGFVYHRRRMSVCPWCKAKVPAADQLCPTCGKNPVDHPSIASGGYSNLNPFDDFDEPEGDLELSGTMDPLAQEHGPDVFGGDLFDDPPASLKLDIDVAPIREPVRPRLGSQQPRTGLSGAPASPSGSPPSYRMQSGAPPDEPVDPAFDPYEIAVLADYGPPPTSVLACPAYAWRVHGRKRELQRRLSVARGGVTEAERARDDHLAELAETVRPDLEASKELAVLLETLVQVESTAQTRADALHARNTELSEKVAVIDNEILAQQAMGTEAKAKVELARGVVEEKEGAYNRARALFKRAEIELRNAQQVARAAAGPEAKTAPPEHAARLIELNQILQERHADLAEPKAEMDAARAVMADAESAARVVERSVRELRGKRKAVEQSYQRELGVRSEGVSEAEAERRNALIAIGARLIEMNAPVVPIELRQAFFQSQEALSERALSAERIARAIGSADAESVKKGWLVVAGAVVLGVTLLVLLIALFGHSEG